MIAAGQPGCVLDVGGRIVVAPFPAVPIEGGSDAEPAALQAEMLPPVGLLLPTTELSLAGEGEPAVPAGILVWAAPVLQGAELVGMYDTVDGRARVRARSPRYGHVDLLVDEVVADGPVTATQGPTGTTLGRVTRIEETDDELVLSGRFGSVRMRSNPVAVFSDRWQGAIARDADLATSSVPVERLVGALVDHGTIQVTVTRVPAKGIGTRTVLCARGDHAVALRSALDGDGPQSAVLFHRADLEMRSLEEAGLLSAPLRPLAPPDPDELTAHVTMSIACRDEDGIVSGGIESWLECGTTGWVQLLVERSDEPVGDDRELIADVGERPRPARGATRLVRTPRSVIDLIALLNEHATSAGTQ